MLAALYDVHGNLPALEAVLADARAAGANEFALGGDYALFGPHPAEAVERLRSLPQATWIRGNGERWTAHPEDAPDNELVQGAIGFAREALGGDLVGQLDRLDTTASSGSTLFCHGSPVSDVESFLADPADDERRLLGEGASADRVVFGHTHVQFRRLGPGGVELLNPGSVGMPFDGDVRAAYALIGDDGEVEPRRVPYDHRAAAAAARERLPAFGETIARRIERAAFDA